MNPLYILALGFAFFSTSQGEDDAKTPVTCEPDIHITGGKVTKSKGNEVKSVARFECPEAHYSWPVFSSRCLSSGKWSHNSRKKTPLICKEFRCPAPVLEEGNFFPVNSSYTVGETVSFECYDGYTLKGSTSRTCMKNGRWNGTNAICTTDMQDCPNPGVPAGGRKAGTSYDIGDRVNYYCNDGLVLVGSSTRECLEFGEWSGSAPACHYRGSFDTPEEVAESFTASLASTLGMSNSDSSKQPASVARRIILSKNADLHIYFMIDASESVGEDNFKKAIMLVTNLIEKIASFDVRPRFGVVTYATHPIKVINLNDEEGGDVEAIIDLLEYDEKAKFGAHQDQRGTNTYSALNTVLEMMSFSKTQFKSSWKKIRFVTILFTDGKSNMGKKPEIAAERIKHFVFSQNKTKDYLDMYAFGITEDVDQMEMNKLSSKKPNEKHSFNIKNTDELVKAFNDILDLTTIGNLCGVANDDDTANFWERRPWHVKINIPGSGICSGSIVAPNFILTAAHCFQNVQDNSDIGRISISAGKTNEKLFLMVKDLFMHPNYKITAKLNKNISQFYDYDVALVETTKKIVYSSSVRSICLPCTQETTRALRKPHPKTTCRDQLSLLLPTNNPVQAIFVKEDKETRQEKDGYVTIKTNEGAKRACEEKALHAREYQQVKDVSEVVTENFLCTGGTQPIKEAVSCKGDSGGSLFIGKKWRFIQVGVLSWGVVNVCEDPNPDWASARDFHINLFKVQKWLKEKLGDTLDFVN